MYPEALEANTGDWERWVASREGDLVAMHGSGGISCRWRPLIPWHFDPCKIGITYSKMTHIFKKLKEKMNSHSIRISEMSCRNPHLNKLFRSF